MRELLYPPTPTVGQRSVYICGPMRGIPEFNFPAFDRAAAKFRAAGWFVYSPAEIDRSHGLDEKGHSGADVFTNEDIREFIRRDYGVIVGKLRAENGDALAVLPGWYNSTGATSELHLARWARVQILDAETTHPLRIEFPKPVQIVQPPLMDAGCATGFCSI
jgi:hypothetical protein